MFGNRIHRARKAQGLSLRELAEQVGLSHAAIKKYEDNLVIPSSELLLKLAKVLHVRVEYFFRPDHFNLENIIIQYRKHVDLDKKSLDKITNKIFDKIECRIDLENLFPESYLKTFNSDKNKFSNMVKCKFVDNKSIETFSNQIRIDWNLGLEPLPNLIDIFEEHGIKVFEIDNQEYAHFDGLSAFVNDIPVIVIGNKWPGDRQRFTLAHELAHFLFRHVSTNTSIKVDEEKYCQFFAGAFLLPSESLKNILGKHRNEIEPRELSLIKQEFGISMRAILHRARDSDIISTNVFKKLQNDFKERGWNKQEPGEPYPKQKTYIFEQLIFHALAEDYIGESKAAELMNIPLESFRVLRAMEQPNVTSHQ